TLLRSEDAEQPNRFHKIKPALAVKPARAAHCLADATASHAPAAVVDISHLSTDVAAVHVGTACDLVEPLARLPVNVAISVLSRTLVSDVFVGRLHRRRALTGLWYRARVGWC